MKWGPPASVLSGPQGSPVGVRMEGGQEEKWALVPQQPEWGEGQRRDRRQDFPSRRLLASVHPLSLWFGFLTPSPGVQSEVTPTVADPPLVATLRLRE